MQIPFPTSSETRQAQLRSQIRQRRRLRLQANLLPQHEIPNNSNHAIPAVSSSPTDTSWLELFRAKDINHRSCENPRDQNLNGIDLEIQPIEISRRPVADLHRALQTLVIVSSDRPLIEGEDQRAYNRQNPENLAQFHASNALNVQVHDFEGVFLDELAARFDVFAHQCRKDVLGRDGVFELHLQERARIRVHGRVPKLLCVHFAEAFESGDREIFFGVFDNVTQYVGGLFFGYLRTVSLHSEGWMVEFFNLLGEGAQSFVFGIRSERPVDFLIVRRPKLNFVKAVLFVESDFSVKLQLSLLDFF